MSNEITIFIKEFQIHLLPDGSGQYKPDQDDVCMSAGLHSVCLYGSIGKLYQFLIDGHFEGACKWIAYNEDILSSSSRKRLLHFLLISASCILRFGISQEQIDRDLSILCDFISGLNQHHYTTKDIFDLITSEGCNISPDR